MLQRPSNYKTNDDKIQKHHRIITMPLDSNFIYSTNCNGLHIKFTKIALILIAIAFIALCFSFVSSMSSNNIDISHNNRNILTYQHLTEEHLHDKLGQLESLWYDYKMVGLFTDKQHAFFNKARYLDRDSKRSYNKAMQLARKQGKALKQLKETRHYTLQNFDIEMDKKYNNIYVETQQVIKNITSIDEKIDNADIRMRGQIMKTLEFVKSNSANDDLLQRIGSFKQTMEQGAISDESTMEWTLDLNRYFHARDTLIDTYQKCIMDAIREIKKEAHGQEDHWGWVFSRSQEQKDNNQAEAVKRHYDERFATLTVERDIQGLYRKFKHELQSIATYLIVSRPVGWLQNYLEHGRYSLLIEVKNGISRVPVVGKIAAHAGYTESGDQDFTETKMDLWIELCTLLQDTQHMDLFKALTIAQKFMEHIIMPILNKFKLNEINAYEIYEEKLLKYRNLQSKEGDVNPFEQTVQQQRESIRNCTRFDVRGCMDKIANTIGLVVLIPQECVIWSNNIMGFATVGWWFSTPIGSSIMAYGLSHMQYISSAIVTGTVNAIKYILTGELDGLYYLGRDAKNGGVELATLMSQLFANKWNRWMVKPFGENGEDIWFIPGVYNNYFRFVDSNPQFDEDQKYLVSTRIL